MSNTLSLAKQLIALPSITPEDSGCQIIIKERLECLGFICEEMLYGPETFKVTNIWAKRISKNRSIPRAKLLVFVGHTDVVPTGPLDQWTSPPFIPTIRDGRLYGRGASDMKTSIAAFIVALEEFIISTPEAALDIAVLLTSDEEGPALNGTVMVCKALQERGEKLDYCIVGEPTSISTTGDMIKNGRRGTLSGKLVIKGIQGHIAYPHLAKNPIHMFAPALSELLSVVWDEGNAYFPPTTWQISNIHGGTGATNVTPGTVTVDFNFRFSTESTSDNLRQRVVNLLANHGLHEEIQYDIDWVLGGEPFLTKPGSLISAVQAAIKTETGLTAQLSTTGGTSDGRFMRKICPQVIELGPPSESIHKIDEYVTVSEIESLKNIYRRVLENLALEKNI